MRHSGHQHITSVYLQPGELYSGIKPVVVQTVLGSCVAVTMHAPRINCGAICHALLPNGPRNIAGEHVEGAIGAIFEKMLALGAKQDELVVKLFGGSRVLGSSQPNQTDKPSIGDQNIEQAIRMLDILGLPIVARDTGGDTGRKLFFYPQSGEVFVRKQRSSPALRYTEAKLYEPGLNMPGRRST